jgi:hypothetical protein
MMEQKVTNMITISNIDGSYSHQNVRTIGFIQLSFGNILIHEKYYQARLDSRRTCEVINNITPEDIVTTAQVSLFNR